MRLFLIIICFLFSIASYSENKQQPEKCSSLCTPLYFNTGLTNKGTSYFKFHYYFGQFANGYTYINQKFKDETFNSELFETSWRPQASNKSNWIIGIRSGQEIHYNSKYFNERYLIYAPIFGLETKKDNFSVEGSLEPTRYFQTIGKSRTDLEGMSIRGYNNNFLLIFGLNFKLGD